LFFGPFTASGGMGVVATHAALVTVASGTAGAVNAIWQLDNPVSASQNETLMLSTGGLSIGLDSWQS
jgi:isoaspartyl peptidase/L-asparaginase-like protein (Ntn-hydrolase superfamily)